MSLAANSDQSARALEVAILTFARAIEVQYLQRRAIEVAGDADTGSAEIHRAARRHQIPVQFVIWMA